MSTWCTFGQLLKLRILVVGGVVVVVMVVVMVIVDETSMPVTPTPTVT